MDKDVDRVLNYLTERLDIAINHNSGDEQVGYIRAKGMVKDAREIGFKPDMREKIKEYISELNAEIGRCHKLAEEHINDDSDILTDRVLVRARVLTEVKNDLQGRLEELVWRKDQ